MSINKALFQFNKKALFQFNKHGNIEKKYLGDLQAIDKN